MKPKRNSQHAFVIVGAGQAGARAAETMRTNGFEGRVTLIGNETLYPYERPPLSKAYLLDPKIPSTVAIRDQGFYVNNEIEVLLGLHAEVIDRNRRQIHLSDGRTVAYSKLLLTTGSRPRRLALRGTNLTEIMYLRTVDDSLALRDRLKRGASVVVVGGGLIGLEVAAAATKYGCRVTILELAKTVLTRVASRELSEFVAAVHRDHGVDVRTGIRISRIEHRADSIAVMCDDGTIIDAEMVIVGIGVEPNVELARDAGLTVENGIVVDKFGCTSDPTIYAAGDVANHPNPILDQRLRLESWQHAQNHAICVAKSMVGMRAAYSEIPWSWTEQYGLNIQLLGTPARATRTLVRGARKNCQFTEIYLIGDRIVGAASVNSAKDIGLLRKIITEKLVVDQKKLVDVNAPIYASVKF